MQNKMMKELEKCREPKNQVNMIFFPEKKKDRQRKGNQQRWLLNKMTILKE